MVKYLILDPGNSTGYCVINIINDLDNTEGGQLSVIKYGFYDIDRSSKYMGDWCLDFKKWIKSMIDENNVEEIIREGYFFSRSFRQGANVNVAYRTVIDMVARKRKMVYHVVQPGEWKISICGRSRPNKIQIMQYGKSSANKYMVQEALFAKYKIKFANFSLSQKNGKPIKFRHDTSDAVAMGVYFGVKKQKCSVIKVLYKRPDDIVFTKKVKTFDYEKIGSYNNCEHTFKSGKRKGERCDRVCFDGKLCTTHTKKKVSSFL